MYLIRIAWQLLKTAALVRELMMLGLFEEVRITKSARGVESRLFVRHHGVQSIMTPKAAVGLCDAMRKTG